jgi:hypothetical protein
MNTARHKDRRKKSAMEKENVFRLPGDFFKRDKVVQIRSMHGGETFLVILLELHARFTPNGGKISVDDTEVSAEQTLQLIARETDSRLIDARMAVDLFLEMGFMEEKEGFLYLTDIQLAESREGGMGNGR